MATNNTQSLARQRNSLPMQTLKNNVPIFLQATNASPEISYHMLADLSKRMNMPFYGIAKNTVGIPLQSNRMRSNEVIKAYCRLFIDYYVKTKNIDFLENLINALYQQQQQHLRRLSMRTAKQKQKRDNIIKQGAKGVWEHPIPVSYSAKVLVDYIIKNQLKDAEDYIDFVWNKTYQVFLEKKYDLLLNQCSLQYDMPSGWDWKNPNCNDPFARYIAAGIPQSAYL